MLVIQDGLYVRDLLNIEIGATLNMAFCELHHRRHCSGALVDRGMRQGMLLLPCEVHSVRCLLAQISQDVCLLCRQQL